MLAIYDVNIVEIEQKKYFCIVCECVKRNETAKTTFSTAFHWLDDKKYRSGICIDHNAK